MPEPLPPEPVNDAAAEPDEDQLLSDLYGPPDADGIHRGEGT